MKAEETRQVTTQAEELAQNAGRVAMGVEADVTTRLRTKAELEQESGLMDAVCERGNLKLAYQRVVENKGAAGVDGIPSASDCLFTGAAPFPLPHPIRWLSCHITQSSCQFHVGRRAPISRRRRQFRD